MTIEETLNSLTNVYEICGENIAAMAFALLGGVSAICYLVMFIKDRVFPRPLSMFATIVCALGCGFSLFMWIKFPTNVTLKVEFDPNVVTQEQIKEYFVISKVSWADGKIACDLSPRYDVYDEVLEVITQRIEERKADANEQT